MAAVNKDPGTSAYEAGEYNRAHRIWLAEAQENNHRAQFYLSTLYARGQGTRQNPPEALNWLRKSAAGGYPAAQFELGNYYFHGIGIDQDFSAATLWWRQAAEQDVTEAQFSLGFAYWKGTGVSQDSNEATRWLEKAAMGGSLAAGEVLEEIRRPATAAAPQPIPTTEQPSSPPVWKRPSPTASPPSTQFPPASIATPAGSLTHAEEDDDGEDSHMSAASSGHTGAGAIATQGEAARTPARQLAPVQEPTAVAPKTRPPEQRKHGLSGSDWVRSRPPEHYTIQIYGDQNQGAVEDFARQIASDYGELALFASLIDGKTWYGLAVGEYPSREAAEAAKRTLPLERWNRPGWLRSFGQLQQQLKH